MVVCPRCGEDNPDRARFCLACATPLASERASRREARKVVTIVFSDVVGSTTIGEHLDAESLRRVMARYFGVLRAALERHGGTVEKFIGDAVMAVFGIPTIHEDDAVRAVRAAAEMRAALELLNGELEAAWGVRLHARTGVNTGEVVAGDSAKGEVFATGDAVNVAARLEQAAGRDEILLGSATERLVRPAVRSVEIEPLAIKGKAGPVRAFRLLDVFSAAVPDDRRLTSPLVGRGLQLLALEDALQRALADRVCRRVTVLGTAGVGKSRLTHEFVASLGERTTVVRGRCLPYGEGITFWPIAEVVKAAAGIRDEESRAQARQRLAALVSAEDAAASVLEPVSVAIGLSDGAVQPEEIFWAVRKLLEAIARERALVVIFDDIHWAEPTFLDLLEYITAFANDAPILLLCLARPELLELRPQWPSGPAESVMRLEPLDANACRAMLENLLGPSEITEQVSDRIAESAEGNPLFVEEFLRMLVDDGHLRRDDEHWAASGELGAVSMPPTIHAVLDARLDRLSPGQRAVIERAAVMGKVFWRGAVSELCIPSARVDLGRHLQTLVSKELVRPARESFVGEDGFRFGHLLIRDAAYGATLKELRLELHEHFADWVERKAGERSGEYDELVGYHLEQAYGYLAELAPPGASGRRLARRAAERLGAAARKALARGDLPAAVNLLDRVLALLPADAESRPEFLLELGVALIDTGEFARAGAVLEEAMVSARSAGERCLVLHADIERRFLALQTDPASTSGDQIEPIAHAVPVFEQAGYERGLARACFLLGYIDLARRCAYGAGAAMLERALVHARRACDERGEAEIMFWLAVALQWGPTPAPEAIVRGEEMRTRTAGRPMMDGALLYQLALAHAMCGRTERARQLCSRGRTIFEELGLRAKAAGSAQVAGMVDMLAGDPVEAEAQLRWSYETLVEMGESNVAATSAALLAEALVQLGRHDEARQFSEASEAKAADDDIASQILWRTAKAKTLAHDGDFEAAASIAREAVAIADDTDLLFGRGEAWTTLGTVLAASKREVEARNALRKAIDVHEAKQDVASLRRARALLEAITPPRPS
jgi:class 3 adenylate cyclase/tetratricopeptide (TPR) repeat protein